MMQEAPIVKAQGSHMLIESESPRPSESTGMQFNSVNRNVFFARHNPHPNRVCIMKGLWGTPICMVNDDPLTNGSHEAPALNFPPQHFLDYKINAGSGSGNIPAGMINLAGPYRTLPNDTITALQYFTGMRNYSTRDKLVPQFGGSQIKENWRHELQTLTKSAVAPFLDRYLERQQEQSNKYPDSRIQHPASWMNIGQPMSTSRDGKTPLYSASGRIIPPSSRNLQSRRSKTAANLASLRSSGSTPIQSAQQRSATSLMGDLALTENMESEVFTMLCGILQTEDEHAIQSWLSGSSDREKALVISIIQSALANRQEYFNLNPEGTIKQVPDTAKNDFHLPPINEAHDLEQQIIGGKEDANRLVIEDDRLENKENNHALPPPTSALFESSPAKAQQATASGSTTQRSHQSELKKAYEMKQKQKEDQALKKEAKTRAAVSSNKTPSQTHRKASGQSTNPCSRSDMDQSNITEGHSLLAGNIQKTWNQESSIVAGSKA